MLTFSKAVGKLGSSRIAHEHGNPTDGESPDFAWVSLRTADFDSSSLLVRCDYQVVWSELVCPTNRQLSANALAWDRCVSCFPSRFGAVCGDLSFIRAMGARSPGLVSGFAGDIFRRIAQRDYARLEHWLRLFRAIGWKYGNPLAANSEPFVVGCHWVSLVFAQAEIAALSE
jgi:hypothetical protein